MSENENENASEPPTLDGNELVSANIADGGQTSGSHEQRGEEQRVPSRQEILNKLNQMPGLVAMGLLPTPRANAIRGIYQTVLSHLGDSSPAGSATVADEDLVAVLRTKPELLKMFKPLLTQEQLDLIVREATHD